MPSKSDSSKPGVLHIVATPIGNLGDLSRRAGEILAAVDLVLAEDTRHSRKLLNGMNIKTPVRAFHKDNETKATAHAIARLAAGAEVALVADAGTPLISDPGFKLVRQAHEKGIRVSPIPGPAALIAALSASGIAPDRFLFEGFAPEKQAARRKRLQTLAGESRTLIFYEAPHRITAFLDDAIAVFSGNREASIARELTKKFETIRRGELAGLKAWIEHARPAPRRVRRCHRRQQEKRRVQSGSHVNRFAEIPAAEAKRPARRGAVRRQQERNLQVGPQPAKSLIPQGRLNPNSGGQPPQPLSAAAMSRTRTPSSPPQFLASRWGRTPVLW